MNKQMYIHSMEITNWEEDVAFGGISILCKTIAGSSFNLLIISLIKNSHQITVVPISFSVYEDKFQIFSLSSR